ncbi:MAG: thiamine phosphate synthase [Betaproteobacteria bacterium]|nr:thiamine phosphate synthase [Betaproteobacteria bacterium]
MSPAIRGLYAVTPDVADTFGLLAKVEAALAGGASLLQYRNKSAGAALKLVQARALLPLCGQYGVPLIINDDLELALALDAAGLHLGVEDGSLSHARGKIGPDRILGASCYDAFDNAVGAARAGASYVAFGSFFPSSIKPGAVRAPLSLLARAKRDLAVPVVAIGGITLDNAAQLIAAGADSVAVISGVFSAPDVEAAARRFSSLFEEHRT